MAAPRKRITLALTLSTTFIIFNIIAVIQGPAAFYYSEIESIISSILPTL